jgi:hypothetical protein
MSGNEKIEKRTKASLKIALGLPRREAKEIDSFLQSVLPTPVTGYSRPLLGRALAEFALRSRPFNSEVLGPIILGVLIPIQLVAVAWFDGAGWLEFGFLIAAYFLTALVFSWLAMVRERRADSGRRRRARQILAKEVCLAQEKKQRDEQRNVLIIDVLLAGIVFYLAHLLEPDQRLSLSIRAVAAFVWGVLLIFFGILIMRYILGKSAPQAWLVRLLASACGMLMIASPAQSRNAQYRRTAATQLSAAAAIIEGRTLHILAAIPVPNRASEWRQVRDSAAGLRRLAARMVTRGPDAWEEIRRSVAFALATAVAGALVNAESDSPPEDEAAIVSRLSRMLHSARNLLVAFLPAIGVTIIILSGDRYGWEWAREARPVLIQFAVVSVLIGLMSAMDPSGYQQRLSAITGAGGSIFGRRG